MLQNNRIIKRVAGCRLSLGALFVVASSVAGCGGVAPAAEDKAAADEVTASWVNAFNGGDAGAVAALYADDARSIPPAGGVITGPSEIESYWREDIGSGEEVTKLVSNNSIAQGDLLHVDGTYAVETKDAVVLARGQYQQLWRRVGGQWKVQSEIWRLDPSAQRDTALADRLESLWTNAYNAGDVAALTALYDQDAVLSARPTGSVEGNEAIGMFWTIDFAGERPKTTLTLTDVYLAGDLAHLEGEYEVSSGKDEITKGHYVQLWMQESGAWRIHREMWWQ
jgi:ketosteroid isomerase-like protein